MIKTIHHVVIAAFFLILSFRVYADNNFPGGQSGNPIEITSDSMDIFKDKKLVVFSGKAKVMQGKSVLKSDKLFLYYKTKPDNENKIGIIKTDKIGDLERIEAKGNVYLNNKEKIATGDGAIYDRDSNKVIILGNATLKDGKNFIKGNRVIVFLNENRGMVEGNTQKQVKAIIYPDSVKKDEQNETK